MATAQIDPPRTRPIYFYFTFLSLLVYLLSPEWFLDIPTTYMLKNHLHASAPQVSTFRLLTGIPLYVAFLFGLVRDLWNPFGLRDRGYLRDLRPHPSRRLHLDGNLSPLSCEHAADRRDARHGHIPFYPRRVPGSDRTDRPGNADDRPPEYARQFLLPNRHHRRRSNLRRRQRKPHATPDLLPDGRPHAAHRRSSVSGSRPPSSPTPTTSRRPEAPISVATSAASSATAPSIPPS